MYDLLKLFQTGRSHMVVLTDSLANVRAEAEAAAAAAAEAAAAEAEAAASAAGGGGGGDELSGSRRRRAKAARKAEQAAAAAAAEAGGGAASGGEMERSNSGPVPFPDWEDGDFVVPIGIITIEDVIGGRAREGGGALWPGRWGGPHGGPRGGTRGGTRPGRGRSWKKRKALSGRRPRAPAARPASARH
jgi:hypothetical protein